MYTTERVAITLRAVQELRAEIESWLHQRRADPRFARFAGHFIALEGVLHRMLEAIEQDVAAVDPDRPSGLVYERCRAADQRLAIVARIHAWYADKYDQRLDDVTGTVLQAADEVVRSCWAEAFGAVDRVAPTGPLVHLDARFDAVATPRVSVPTDLRAPRDALVGKFVRELPIPVLALPALCRSEPWWVVLAAHETGHHVQHDLAPDLVALTQDVIAAATAGDADGATCWSAWAQEVFADAFAALTVGPAAAWAVEELQHGEAARLITAPSPGSRYPPPAVRTALLGELAREVGADAPGPGAADVARWLTTVAPAAVARPVQDAVAAQLPLARPVARALMELRVDGVPLREVCGWVEGTFAAGGPVARWAQVLRATSPVLAGRAAAAAARHGIAGGVAAYRALVRSASSEAGEGLKRLRDRLPAVLATCGPPGTLAAVPPPDVATVAARLTDRLLATVDDGTTT